MARTTISLPDDLKQRMDAVKEPVNWSQVAAHAFEIRLGEIASRNRKVSMNDTIQRLRASKLQGESLDKKEGFEKGESWARNQAEWRELTRLEKEVLGDNDFWDEDNPDEKCWPLLVYTAIGNEGAGYTEAEEFWSNYKSGSPSREWFEGFFDGAMHVLTLVESEV